MKSAIGVGLVLACISGCGDDGSAPPVMTTAPNATAAPMDESDLLSGSPRFERFAACTTQSDCLEVEQCVVGPDESFHICLAPCNDVDDCAGASGAGGSAGTVVCSEFIGEKRCVLSCQSADECSAGMTCTLGVCVWG